MKQPPHFHEPIDPAAGQEILRGFLLGIEDVPGRWPMTTFRRIKIQATVETAATLLTEDQIAGAVRELRDGLTQLNVAIVGIEAKEEPAVELPPSLEYRD